MRKRWKVVVFLACLVALGLFGIALPDRQPSYADLPLSEWIQRAQGHTTEATNAIQQIGTRGLPFLVSWIQVNDNPWRRRLATTLLRFSESRQISRCRSMLIRQQDEIDMRACLAANAFSVLGAQAAPAVPELAILARSRQMDMSSWAIAALAGIGTNSFPVLLQMLTDPICPARGKAARTIGMPGLGSLAQQAVPALIRATQDADPTLATYAAKALGQLAVQPDLAVPALITAMRHVDPAVRKYAARSLPQFAGAAAPAVPALQVALIDPDPSVRTEVTNALHQIATNFPTKAPH